MITTEALDLSTPAGRAMAGLLAIFAEFEREILRERTRAGLAHARANGKRLGRPATAAIHAITEPKRYPTLPSTKAGQTSRQSFLPQPNLIAFIPGIATAFARIPTEPSAPDASAAALRLVWANFWQHNEGREVSVAKPDRWMPPGESVFLSYVGPLDILQEVNKYSASSLVRAIGQKYSVALQKLALFKRMYVVHLLLPCLRGLLDPMNRPAADMPFTGVPSDS